VTPQRRQHAFCGRAAIDAGGFNPDASHDRIVAVKEMPFKTWLVCAAAGALAAGAAPSLSLAASHVQTLPRHRLTPGAHLTAGKDVVCRASYPAKIPKLSSSKRNAIYIRYSLKRHPRRFVIDHLIPVDLGGSNATTNLWPQRYRDPWGARSKDQLETRLHSLVCSGKLTLSSAQRQIATDWISAYKRHVPVTAGGSGPAPEITNPTESPNPAKTVSSPVKQTTPGSAPADTPASPVAPMPDRIYWGAYIDGAPYGYDNPPWDMRAVSTFEAHAGKTISILHFGLSWYVGGSAQPFLATPFETVRQHGSIPMVDWNSTSGGGVSQPNFSLSRIIDGTYDSYITAWAAGARAWGHPFFLRFDHEMNGRWFPWNEGQNGNTTGQYVQAWRHIHNIFTSIGASNVSWVWCPNAEYPGSLPLEGLYPGDSYVDWTCMDAYNFGTNPLKSDVWRSFAQAAGPTYTHLAALAPSKPMMVGETASSEYGGAKPAWISAALASLPSLFPKIKAFVWFNWSAGGEDWPIESSASAAAAFAAGISSDYFAPATFGSLGQSPIPPPA
jgi:mannan endo-1,4-beta-mannosidase